MTTDLCTSEKIVAYDGDCPMCRSTVRWLERMGVARKEQLQSNDELDANELALATAAGIRNQLVVIDRQSRQTKSGFDGLLWVAAESPRHALAAKLLGLPGVRQIGSWGYQMISYNRRIISPPLKEIKCDCEPEVTFERRLTLIVPLVVVSTLLVAAFGAVMFWSSDWKSPATGALLATSVWTLSFATMALVAALCMPCGVKVDYLGHLSVTMFAGALVLLLFTLAMLIAPLSTDVVLAPVAIVAGGTQMIAMQRTRLRVLGLSGRWLFVWLAALGGFALVAAFAYGPTA